MLNAWWSSPSRIDQRAGRHQEDRVLQQRRPRHDPARVLQQRRRRKKYDEVVREINALRPSLPAEIARLEIKKSNPGLVNIVQFALVLARCSISRAGRSGTRSRRILLKAVDGVRTSETWAYPARELRVALDLPRMAELKLAPSKVIDALRSENTTVPGGAIDVGSRSFSVKTSGSYESLDEVRDTVVAAVDGRTVRIRDIAEVHWDTQEHTYTGRFNGQRAVFVTANQKDGYNIFEVRERIVEAAKKFEQQLPKRIKLELGFDQSDNVATRLNRLTTDFGIAIALVAITLLPLGLRAASIVMISIPLSLAIGVSTLHMVGFSLNQISIAGFVVALGLLVDDSIVVVENISRFLREGHSRTQAAILATRQIFLAILGCTAHDHVCVPAVDDAVRPIGQVHPRAADSGALYDCGRVVADRVDHHSVPRQPHPQQAREPGRQSAAAVGAARHSSFLSAAPAPGVSVAAPDGGGARWLRAS